jgi:predicted DNA-binding transcriptional regulator AlpA
MFRSAFDSPAVAGPGDRVNRKALAKFMREHGQELKPLLNAREAAEILGVSKKRLYSLPIPKVRLSKRRVGWRPERIREFAERREVSPVKLAEELEG